MRVVLVNGERADEVGLAELLRTSGVECVSRRISAECLHADHNIVWRMGSGEPRGAIEAPPSDQPRGLLFELAEPTADALVAAAAIRAEPRFDGFPIIASLSIDHVDWISRAREFDDFLFSPWSPIELFGRIAAAERRRSAASAAEGDAVSIDSSARQVTIGSRSIRLTVRECALFSHLWAQRGSVLSREHLLAHVWGSGYEGGPRTVDVHIRRLRLKLGSAPAIDTVRGGGYRLLASGRPPAAPRGLAAENLRRAGAGFPASAAPSRADAEVSGRFGPQSAFQTAGVFGQRAAGSSALHRSV